MGCFTGMIAAGHCGRELGVSSLEIFYWLGLLEHHGFFYKGVKMDYRTDLQNANLSKLMSLRSVSSCSQVMYCLVILFVASAKSQTKIDHFRGLEDIDIRPYFELERFQLNFRGRYES